MKSSGFRTFTLNFCWHWKVKTNRKWQISKWRLKVNHISFENEKSFQIGTGPRGHNQFLVLFVLQESIWQTLQCFRSVGIFWKWQSEWNQIHKVCDWIIFYEKSKILIHSLIFHCSSNSIFHPPSWQYVSDSLFVYSAFCSKLPLSEQLCPSITILALSKNSEELSNLKCQLW